MSRSIAFAGVKVEAIANAAEAVKSAITALERKDVFIVLSPI